MAHANYDFSTRYERPSQRPASNRGTVFNAFKILLRKPKEHEEGPRMPALPKSRARPLTAVPPMPTATASCDFFQKLPLEIRRRILIEAFGKRVLHFGLRLAHPLKEYSLPPLRPRHANRLQPSERDKSQPRRWQWSGSECHRRRRPLGTPPDLSVVVGKPEDDTCYSGFAPMCMFWPGVLPDKCLIGVTGWLLACRQAYIEGIEVLYRTNRLHIGGSYLVHRLPDLLVPRRREAIRSVELIWSIRRRGNQWAGNNYPEFPIHFEKSLSCLLEVFPETLPNLTFLYQSLQEQNPPADYKRVALYSEELLRLVDEMVVKLRHLSVCHVAQSSVVYRAIQFKEKGENISPEQVEDLEDGADALWRCLPEQKQLTQNSDTHDVIKGYWIRLGMPSLRLDFVP